MLQGDKQKLKEEKWLLSTNISGCLLENPSFSPSVQGAQFQVGCEHHTKQGSSSTTSPHSSAAGARLTARFSFLNSKALLHRIQQSYNQPWQTNQQNNPNPSKKQVKKKLSSFFPPFSWEVDYQSIQRGFHSLRRWKTKAMLLPLHALSSAEGICDCPS